MPERSPIEAAVALGVANGVRTREPRILNDGSNLLVHLQPAPAVVRVATFTGRVRRDPLPFLEREVRLATLLVAAGAAVAPPSSLIAPGPHVDGRWAMTAWTFVDHVPGVIPDDRRALVALDELHAAMGRIAIELPLLNPATGDLDLVIAFAIEHRLMTDAEGLAIRSRRDGILDELLATTTDRQPLHGDAFPRNSLLTASGVVWIDLEDCCSGPAAWDHAVLIRNVEDPTVERTLRDRDGDAAIDAAMALREIQAGIWRLLHDARREGRLDGST
jgi:hypothetical protein